jgi:hypothetical protein
MRRALHTVTRRTRMIALAGLVCGLGGAPAAHAQDEPARPCGHGIPPERTAVVLHLIDHAGLSADAREALRLETLAPWRGTGVAVSWAADGASGDGGPGHVYITLTRAGEPPRGPGHGRPLASILFVGGRPTTQIRAYVNEFERLAAALRVDDRAWLELPRLRRDRLLGRALGRAVAHEVGHYVFASAAHASGGLMRPHHPIERLMTQSGAPFEVLSPP